MRAKRSFCHSICLIHRPMTSVIWRKMTMTVEYSESWAFFESESRGHHVQGQHLLQEVPSIYWQSVNETLLLINLRTQFHSQPPMEKTSSSKQSFPKPCYTTVAPRAKSSPAKEIYEQGLASSMPILSPSASVFLLFSGLQRTDRPIPWRPF